MASQANEFPWAVWEEGLENRLLAILRLGGRRKLNIIRAWGSWAGYRLEEFDQRLSWMVREGKVVEKQRGRKVYLALGPKS